jgi:triosephosphate isomerase
MRWIVGNWKMHRTHLEAAALAAEVVRALGSGSEGVAVAVCPPFPALDRVSQALAGSRVRLGAQDVFWEDEGPYTGEVSAPMLRALGCAVAIVGHSERRAHLGETDAMVARKLRACWRHGLMPVLCVGETWEERTAGLAADRLRAQVRAALEGADPAPLLVAYEPVWAIGTGQPATPRDCREGLDAVREELRRLWGDAAQAPCLYGGSVTPDNCQGFWDEGTADGALVGGASLDAAAFAAICRRAGRGVSTWSR